MSQAILDRIKPTNSLLIALYFLITLGLYGVWWFYSVAVVIKENEEIKISLAPVVAFAFGSVFYLTYSVAPSLSPLFTNYSFYIEITQIAIYIWVLFVFASALEQVFYQAGVNDYGLMGILTFVLGPIWLQHKINAAKGIANASHNQ